jgi:hypothetical protein
MFWDYLGGGVGGEYILFIQCNWEMYYVMDIVRQRMGWVRNVVLMNVYLDLEKPRGVGILGEGPHGAGEGNGGVSLRATRERGGRILSQQGGFKVSGKGQTRGARGTRGARE